MRRRAILYATTVALVLTAVTENGEAVIRRPPRKPKDFRKKTTPDPLAPGALPAWAEGMREEERKEREELARKAALRTTAALPDDDPASEPPDTPTVPWKEAPGAPRVAPAVVPTVMPAVVPTVTPEAIPASVSADAAKVAPNIAPPAVPSFESTVAPTVAPAVSPNDTTEHTAFDTETLTDIYNGTRNFHLEDSNPPEFTVPIMTAEVTTPSPSEITSLESTTPKITPITPEITAIPAPDQLDTPASGLTPLLNATVNPRGKGHSCILASMRITLTVPYKNTDSQNETTKITVPSYAQSGGTCGGDNESGQELFYTWNWRQLPTRSRHDTTHDNRVSFLWTKNGEKFALSHISMSITKTKSMIPDWDDTDTAPATASADGLALFEAPVGQAFACYSRESAVDLGDGAGITLSDVLLQAFNEETDAVAEAVRCSPGDAASNAVWVAVGCVLGALVLILAAGVVYRGRSRRGTYFVPAKQMA